VKKNIFPEKYDEIRRLDGIYLNGGAFNQKFMLIKTWSGGGGGQQAQE
jgi:hypothetical protein